MKLIRKKKKELHAPRVKKIYRFFKRHKSATWGDTFFFFFLISKPISIFCALPAKRFENNYFVMQKCVFFFFALEDTRTYSMHKKKRKPKMRAHNDRTYVQLRNMVICTEKTV